MERISIKNFDVASMNKLQNEKFVNCFHHQVGIYRAELSG